MPPATRPPAGALPSLSNLATAPTSTGVPPAQALTDDAKDAIFKMLTDGDKPEKICERWSIWCDVKSGDAMCADTDEGRNDEHWKKGCKLLGLNTDQPFKVLSLLPKKHERRRINAALRELVDVDNPTTWRGWFNYLCNGLHDAMGRPGERHWRNDALAWYKLWIRAMPKEEPGSAENTGWFWRCAVEVFNCVHEDLGLDADEKTRPLTNAILSHMNRGAIQYVHDTLPKRRPRLPHAAQLPFYHFVKDAFDPRENLDSQLVDFRRAAEHPGGVRAHMKDLLVRGANPQVGWVALANKGATAATLASIEDALNLLLEHVAIDPNMLGCTAWPSRAQRVNRDRYDQDNRMLSAVVSWCNKIAEEHKPRLEQWVRTLITHGADVNLKGSEYGDPPLLLAEDISMVKLLLGEGADPTRTGRTGRTLLELSIGPVFQPEILETLLQYSIEWKIGSQVLKRKHWFHVCSFKLYGPLRILWRYYGGEVWLRELETVEAEDRMVIALAAMILPFADREREIHDFFAANYPGQTHKYRPL
jgi:hypothetical protein